MLPSEIASIRLFAAVVLSVYSAAAGMAVFRLVQRFKRISPSLNQRLFARFVFGAAALGILCFAYGYFIEPYWVDVTHVRLASAKFRPGTGSVRVVHISDLHCDPAPRLEERLPGVIAAQKPDLIVFTGDCVNSPMGVRVFKRCLTRLAEIAPTYVVKGNWDAWYWSNLDLFGSTGAKELVAEAASLRIRGLELCLVGVPVGEEEKTDRVLESVSPTAFVIFLYHYPDMIMEVARHNVDLYCAGHTHGGQVALPFYGALVTFSRFGKRFEAGLYRVGKTWLYVNRGIGVEGGIVPRVRFCARPEITVIDLIPVQ